MYEEQGGLNNLNKIKKFNTCKHNNLLNYKEKFLQDKFHSNYHRK